METINNPKYIEQNGHSYLDAGDFADFYANLDSPEIYLVKHAVKITIANGGERVTPIEDGAAVQIALPGDIICQNPSDQGQYIYRYDSKAFEEGQEWDEETIAKQVEARQTRFYKDYIEDPSNPGVYLDNGSVRPAKITNVDVGGSASYGGLTYTLAGGAIVWDFEKFVEKGLVYYTISEGSMGDYYIANPEQAQALKAKQEGRLEELTLEAQQAKEIQDGVKGEVKATLNK